jgi:hypothetical protein
MQWERTGLLLKQEGDTSLENNNNLLYHNIPGKKGGSDGMAMVIRRFVREIG